VSASCRTQACVPIRALSHDTRQPVVPTRGRFRNNIGLVAKLYGLNRRTKLEPNLNLPPYASRYISCPQRASLLSPWSYRYASERQDSCSLFQDAIGWRSLSWCDRWMVKWKGSGRKRAWSTPSELRTDNIPNRTPNLYRRAKPFGWIVEKGI
jgi:hypothetical protein